MLTRFARRTAAYFASFIPRENPPLWKAISIGALCSLAGATLRFSVEPLVDGGIPVVLFYPFILLAATLAGAWAGLASVLLSGAIADYFWLGVPGFNFDRPAIVTLSAFTIVSLFAILMAAVFRALIIVQMEAQERAMLLATRLATAPSICSGWCRRSQARPPATSRTTARSFRPSSTA